MIQELTTIERSLVALGEAEGPDCSGGSEVAAKDLVGNDQIKENTS
jgi:hypothetical protein